MDDLLESDKLKLKLLKVISDGKFYSYYTLSKILKTNYNSIKKNCNFLELLGLIEVIKISREESATGVPSYRVKITKKGLEVVRRF